jgi:acetyl-CoA C-acetyltransferase
MPEVAYIVAAARTPVGRRNGGLSKMHPADLGAIVVDAVVERAGIPGDKVDDVIFGCVSQHGAQAGNIARTVVLSSKKLPESVPGTTVDRQCGSSQQAIHFAAQAVMSGTQDIVIAGGVEVMSLLPIGSNFVDGLKHEPSRGNPWTGPAFVEKYGKKLAKFGQKIPSQFLGAELLVHKHKLTRDDLDSAAEASHARAAAATKNGYFKREIVPVTVKNADGTTKTLTVDEGIRPDTTREKLSKLKPMFPEGNLTAGTASQISDGAAALLIASESAVKKYNLKPLAKIVSLALCGCDPIVMLEGPVFASKTALEKANLKIEDIDIYEVNEAFASVPLAFQRAHKADLAKLNVNGSAMALGHPLGATGARIFTSAVHELHRRGGRYALISICEGGGTANATIIERVGGAPSKL